MKNTLKKALKFILCILPFSIVAGISISFYELNTGIAEQILKQMSSSSFVVLVTIQTIIYALICGFVGYLIAEKIGLIREFSFAKQNVITAIICGIACGVLLFGLDYFIFAKMIPQVAEYYNTYPFSLAYIISEITYGGVVEEILLRWFLMSIFVFIVWKIFARKYIKDDIPTWIFVLANVLAAGFFAAGHLPATFILFGELGFVIILRCMLLNGLFGLVFGWLYRKIGIQYSMIAHAMTHVCCDALIFLAIGLNL